MWQQENQYEFRSDWQLVGVYITVRSNTPFGLSAISGVLSEISSSNEADYLTTFQILISEKCEISPESHALKAPPENFIEMQKKSDAIARSGRRDHTEKHIVRCSSNVIKSRISYYFPGRLHAEIDTASKKCIVELSQSICNEKQVVDGLLRFILGEVLKTVGVFQIHAASAAINNQAVLVVGTSGAGKSTSSYTLLDKGFSLISDDHPIIYDNGGTVCAKSFYSTVGLSPKSLGLLRKRSLEEERFYENESGKYRIPAKLIASHIDEAPIRLVVFPEVFPESDTVLLPVTKSSALQSCLKHSFFTKLPGVSSVHFGVFSRLILQSRCFKLICGKDINRFPDLVEEYLQ